MVILKHFQTRPANWHTGGTNVNRGQETTKCRACTTDTTIRDIGARTELCASYTVQELPLPACFNTYKGLFNHICHAGKRQATPSSPSPSLAPGGRAVAVLATILSVLTQQPARSYSPEPSTPAPPQAASFWGELLQGTIRLVSAPAPQSCTKPRLRCPEHCSSISVQLCPQPGVPTGTTQSRANLKIIWTASCGTLIALWYKCIIYS